MSMERADAKSEGAEGVDRGNSSSRAGEAAHWLGAALQARLWPPGRAHPSSRSPPPQAGAQEVSGRRGSGCPRPGPRRRARSSSQTHVERLRGPEGEGAGGGAARAGAGLRRGRGSALSPRAELTGGGGAPERGRGSSRHLCSRLQVGGRGSEERGRDLERRGGACSAGGRGRRGCRTGGAVPRSLSPPPPRLAGHSPRAPAAAGRARPPRWRRRAARRRPAPRGTAATSPPAAQAARAGAVRSPRGEGPGGRSRGERRHAPPPAECIEPDRSNGSPRRGGAERRPVPLGGRGRQERREGEQRLRRLPWPPTPPGERPLRFPGFPDEVWGTLAPPGPAAALRQRRAPGGCVRHPRLLGAPRREPVPQPALRQPAARPCPALPCRGWALVIRSANTGG